MTWDSSAVVTGIVGALVGLVIGLLKTGYDTRVQRNEELRRRRMEAYVGFCGAALEYRRAVLNQWYVRTRLGGKDAATATSPEVDEDVRATRATAWTRYYEVSMLSDDSDIELAANWTLQDAAAISDAVTSDERQDLSDLVHRRVAHFAVLAGKSVSARTQRLEMSARRRAAPVPGTAA